MDLQTLKKIPPWDWPESAGATFLNTLRDDRAAESDRLLAAELAGDAVVIDEELVDALLSVLQNGAESERLRAKAAISLGPVLELADMDGFEEEDGVPVSERTFYAIQESLQALYENLGVPSEVRRRILEASVRAPQDWHHAAIQAAYRSGDEAWKLTAVFCMRFVRGFETEILEALASGDSDRRCEAVRAAGNWQIAAAWPHVAALVTGAAIDKPLLLAAIDAAASIRPEEAGEILGDRLDSEDEDISDAANEAISMAEAQVEAEDGDGEGEEEEGEEPAN